MITRVMWVGDEVFILHSRRPMLAFDVRALVRRTRQEQGLPEKVDGHATIQLALEMTRE